MSAELEPAEVFPLAEYLYDELKARGWTTEHCALHMGYKTDEEYGLDVLTLDFLMCVQEDGCLVGGDLFRKLALAFDVSEDFFRNIDKVWRENPDKRAKWECPEDIFGPGSRAAIPTRH